jgi:hypothetical protein
LHYTINTDNNAFLSSTPRCSFPLRFCWRRCALRASDSDEWANLITKGRERTDRIAAAKDDTTRSDDLTNWYVDKKKGDVVLDNAYDQLTKVNQADNLGLSDKITDRYSYYPQNVAEDDDEAKYASYQLYLDTKAGAIVAGNRFNKPGVKADHSSADVAWSLYKELCTTQQVSYTNLKTILSTEITADYAQELFGAPECEGGGPEQAACIHQLELG